VTSEPTAVQIIHNTQGKQRLGISQSAFAQQEAVSKPRRTTREKIAKAFGINASQLEL